MKPNKFMIIISLLLSLLIGYGFYAANAGELFCILLAVGSGLCCAITLVGILGIKFVEKSENINFRIVSAIFFIFLLITNLVFGITGVKIAPYIIINGIEIIIYAIIEYGIVRSNK